MGCGSGFYVKCLRARGLLCDGFDGHTETEDLTNGLCFHADFVDPELPEQIAQGGRADMIGVFAWRSSSTSRNILSHDLLNACWLEPGRVWCFLWPHRAKEAWDT
eukprot:g18003.t1